LDRVLVATDDRRVEETVRGFGGEVVMTSKDHASGTERLAEVARKIEADWVVNVQGDLPFIQSETIVRAVRPMRRDRRSQDSGQSRLMKKWCNPNTSRSRS
jgi:3-deoxy-manno-octulosonate cytidylyltransferase (CMP-KDO synthetase)